MIEVSFGAARWSLPARLRRQVLIAFDFLHPTQSASVKTNTAAAIDGVALLPLRGYCSRLVIADGCPRDPLSRSGPATCTRAELKMASKLPSCQARRPAM